jgi:hypothetical protein
MVSADRRGDPSIKKVTKQPGLVGLFHDPVVVGVGELGGCGVVQVVEGITMRFKST